MQGINQIKQANINKMPPRFSYFWFQRIASIYITWIFQWVPIAPNGISMLAHLCIIIASILFAFGDFTYNLIAILFLHISMTCDFVDGCFARVKNKLSKYNASFLDRIFHEITTAFIFIGIGIGTTIHYGNAIHFLLGVMAAIFMLINSYMFQLKNWILTRYKEKIDEEKATEVFVDSPIMKLGLKMFIFPMKYIRFITLIFVLIQRMDIYILLYGLFLPFRTFIYFCFMYINFRKLDKENAREK